MTIKFRVFALSLGLAVFAPALIVPDIAVAAESKGKGQGKGGEGKGNSHSREGGRSEGPGGGPHSNKDIDFNDGDRRTIQDYFNDVARQGKCPPGLAKKNNGCLPPGQAKKWEIGRPLPRDVIYHAVPRDLLGRITPPPLGYKYVRVASDLLLISSGTGRVAAAIENLARY